MPTLNHFYKKPMDEALLQQLRRSQDAELGLRNALDTASIGYWSWVTDEAMQWDAHMLRLFGIDQDQIPASLDDFLLLLDEGSQESAMEAFDAALTKNEALNLEIVAEKSRSRLQLSGRPYLLPGAEALALGGLCMEKPPSGSTASYRQATTMELANFASVASHDMREPLRMITSYLRLLEERSPDALDERARRYIKYACEGADRMRDLLDDLLSYARLETEAGPLSPIALTDVLTETMNILSTSIGESKADITVTLERSPVVLGDRNSLIRLFQNLIGNAIKFHAPGESPQVEIGMEDGDEKAAPGFWIVAVRDHGIGIDPEHHELLFNVFQRLHTRDEFEGSGIGLAACRKIVERIGGSIRLHSKKGEGSTFRVSLKKANTDRDKALL